MSEDAVYIAWGKPAQILHQEDQRGASTTWLYEGAWMEETRYWIGRRYVRLPNLAQDAMILPRRSHRSFRPSGELPPGCSVMRKFV